MLTIIGYGLNIAAMIVGDMLLAKWLGALNLYIDRFATPAMKKAVADEYQRQITEWDNLPTRPPEGK